MFHDQFAEFVGEEILFFGVQAREHHPTRTGDNDIEISCGASHQTVQVFVAVMQSILAGQLRRLAAVGAGASGLTLAGQIGKQDTGQDFRLSGDMGVFDRLSVVDHLQRMFHQVGDDLNAEGVRGGVVRSETYVARFETEILAQMSKSELFRVDSRAVPGCCR